MRTAVPSHAISLAQRPIEPARYYLTERSNLIYHLSALETGRLLSPDDGPLINTAQSESVPCATSNWSDHHESKRLHRNGRCYSSNLTLARLRSSAAAGSRISAIHLARRRLH